METAIYNSYLNGEERELAIQEAKEEALFAKLNTMYEMVEMNLKLNLQEAEVKVFEESGTYDDLGFLYEEANEDANKKKGGILSAIVNAVKSIFAAIRNTITKVFGKNPNPPAEVEVDEADEGKVKALNAVWSKIQQILNFLKNSTGVKVAGGIAAAGAAIVAGISIFEKKTGKTVKKPWTVVKGWADDLAAKSKAIDDTISDMDTQTDSNGEKKKALDVLKTIGQAIKTFVNWIGSKVGGVVSDTGEKITNAATNVGEKLGGKKQEPEKWMKTPGKKPPKGFNSKGAGLKKESADDNESMVDGVESIFGYKLTYEAAMLEDEALNNEIDELADAFEGL